MDLVGIVLPLLLGVGCVLIYYDYVNDGEWRKPKRICPPCPQCSAGTVKGNKHLWVDEDRTEHLFKSFVCRQCLVILIRDNDGTYLSPQEYHDEMSRREGLK